MNTRLPAFFCGLALLALAAAQPARAAESAGITMGLISTGTVEQTLENWKPLTDALARELQMPVKVVASKNYADISNGMMEGKLQLAWINNKQAIELVEKDQAQVFAQMVRVDGTRGYKALLLARKDSPLQSATDMLAKPGTYRLGLGDKKSTSGYLVPSYYVFAKNKIEPDKHFTKISYGSHRDNFLAVAEGQVDVGTNNTEDMERFKTELPAPFAKVKVIWESPLIPNDPILYRKDLPAATQQKLRKFFLAYGRNDAEKAALKAINGLSSFKVSSNYQLRPVVDLELFQALTRAMAADAGKGGFSATIQQLTERAAKLDAALTATRLESQ